LPQSRSQSDVLKVDPEQPFFISSSKGGFSTIEWVNKWWRKVPEGN